MSPAPESVPPSSEALERRGIRVEQEGDDVEDGVAEGALEVTARTVGDAYVGEGGGAYRARCRMMGGSGREVRDAMGGNVAGRRARGWQLVVGLEDAGTGGGWRERSELGGREGEVGRPGKLRQSSGASEVLEMERASASTAHGQEWCARRRPLFRRNSKRTEDTE